MLSELSLYEDMSMRNKIKGTASSLDLAVSQLAIPWRREGSEGGEGEGERRKVEVRKIGGRKRDGRKAVGIKK